jgi:RimJ/RimL family protein N-acetyltransferase
MKTLSTLFNGKLVYLAAPLPGDAELFSLWSRDAEYLRQVDTDYAFPGSPAEMLEKQNHFRSMTNGVLFHLRTVDQDRLIGFIAVHSIEWNNRSGKLSMGIGEAEYRNKGYGSEALRLALNYSFNELNLHRVGLDVIASNMRAVHTYEKAGFQHEGLIRQAVHRDGKYDDLLIMGILRDNFNLINS